MIFSFYLSLLIFPINIIIYGFTGLNIQIQNFYYFSAPLLLGMVVYSRMYQHKIKKIPKIISLIFFPYLIINIIFAALNSDYFSNIIYLSRWYLITFIIYFSLETVIKTRKNYLIFIESIVIGSVISSLYTIFEFIGRTFFLFPKFYFNSLASYINNHALFSLNWYVGESGGRGSYLNEFGFHRPVGLFLDNHTSAFFMVACIIILATLGRQLRFNSNKILFFILLNSIAVFLQTSRIYVFALILILLIMLFKKLILFKQSISLKNKHILLFFIFLLPSLFFESVRNIVLNAYLPMLNLFSAEATITSSQIIFSTLINTLPLILSNFLSNYPNIFFFGISYSRFDMINLELLMGHGELHALMSSFYRLGFFGLSVYFLIFIKSGIKLFKAYKGKIKNLYKSEALCAFLIIFLFFLSYLHYNSISFVNQFILALVLFITNQFTIIKKKKITNL